MYIFTEQELKQHISLNLDALSVVEEGFSYLAEDKVTMPPIMRVDVHDHNGEVDVKTAYVEGKDMFAIKVSSGFFNNYQIGLPSGSGLMMLISAKTGVPQAILLDNGYLTDIRTAAAGAIAAKYLSREKIQTVGVIGSGSQARYQVKALRLVRDFQEVLVYGRSVERATAYAEEMSAELGIEVKAVESAEAVVRNSDLVITTTPAKEPVIKAEWLHPGIHITAMGSDAEHKQELEAEVLAQAGRLVCDTIAQCERLGELHHAYDRGLLSREQPIVELGELTSQKTVGRQDEEQITICDLTGTGVQDTAIALFAFQEMLKRGLGLEIENKEAALKN
ncbi:cyclodeaminase [Fictibacillus sp. KIGAM418]|uniref:Cyclodeaminase n=1 Tax=Fictibacillus marinisediminis TaxID=2878389 RepID=A0A9X1X9W3_9BACL|nr:cyclodeaminase [Fictibacillus marinisediminis]MCK6256276.1 cyclodeaminase [Fictibacillus marinisediminis]